MDNTVIDTAMRRNALENQIIAMMTADGFFNQPVNGDTMETALGKLVEYMRFLRNKNAKATT